MPSRTKGSRVKSAARSRTKPKTPASKKKASNAVAKKIAMLRKEGKSGKQAVAMALAMKGKKKAAPKKKTAARKKK